MLQQRHDIRRKFHTFQPVSREILNFLVCASQQVCACRRCPSIVIVIIVLCVAISTREHRNSQRKEFLIANRQITTKKEQAARNIYKFFFSYFAVGVSFFYTDQSESFPTRERGTEKSLGQITLYIFCCSSSYNFFFSSLAWTLWSFERPEYSHSVRSEKHTLHKS